MLQYVHEGHMGIRGCQSLARASIYWPNINNDIYNMVSNCSICLKYRNANPKEDLESHGIFNIPWYKVGCDLFEFDKRMYLIVVDYYSKFFEVELLSSGYSSIQVITKLKSIFSRHGIPTILISDNGPPFYSKEFRQFCIDWGIDNVTSSPYLSRSNGLAERSIQTVKNILYKCRDSGTDPYIAFLQHRTTSNNNMPSPSELLMSRKLRTKLPSFSNDLKPKLVNAKKVNELIRQKQLKASQNYNRNSVNLKPIEVYEQVYFKKSPTSVWFRGRIIEKCKEPRSFLVKDEKGVVYRRNRQHIMKIGRKLDNLEKGKIRGENSNNDDNVYYNFDVREENLNNNLVMNNEYQYNHENVSADHSNENVNINNNENVKDAIDINIHRQ